MKIPVHVGIVDIAIRALFHAKKSGNFILSGKTAVTSKNARKFFSVIRMSSSE